MKRHMIRRVAIAMLTLVIMLAGTMPVLADNRGNGKGHGKGFELEVRGKGGNSGKLSYKLEFDDVNAQAEWARKYIASLAAKKVFEGYTDGTFQPNKAVSRIEVVASIVRFMGLREEAEDPSKWNVDLLFEDEKQIRKNNSWAVGYLAVAQETGLFANARGKLQPQKSADRLWVTELIVRALGLEQEAQANMNAQLSFKDRKDIPANKIGYVKVALDRGIVTGYTDGTFKPNKSVSRAELAAMLERAEEKLPDSSNDTQASGVLVTAVTNQTLLLETGGAVKSYALDPNAFIFRDGEKVEASSLKVGDTLFIRSYNQVVIFVEVIKKAEEEKKPFTVTGVLKSLTFHANGKLNTITIIGVNNQDATYAVSDSVQLEGQLNELRQGHTVELSGVNNVVSKIRIGDQGFRLQGVIAYVTLNSNGQIATIAIRHVVNGTEQTSVFTVASDVRLTGSLTLLGEGQNIVIAGTQQIVREILMG
jgi:hypothetical protein